MVQNAFIPVIHGPRKDLDDLKRMDNEVDSLHGVLITYLGQLSLKDLTKKQSQQLYDDMAAANYLENIGDMVETNLVESGLQRLEHNLEISASTETKLKALHNKVCWAVDQSVKAIIDSDKIIAAKVEGAKPEINRLAFAVETHLASRLTAREPHRLVAFRLESELIEYLKRVYYFAKRIAKLVTEDEMAYIRTTSPEAQRGA